MFLHHILRRRPKPIFTTHLTTSRSMGGGPRTFPGGLNKWQYKRMHEKLAKEKERKLLHQEKQLYQARLRSEIRARQNYHDPYQQQTNSGNYSAMSSKDHIKALADRFMKQGAEDLWNEDDGPIRLEERPRMEERPLNLRKIVKDGRSTLKQLGSFEHKREYSTFAGGFDVEGLNYLSFYRQIDNNQKMHYRKIMNWSSDDEDDIQYSEGSDLIGKDLKISGFRSKLDGKEKVDRGPRFGETGEKMMSRAALKNFDKKKERRAPRGCEHEEDCELMEQIREMREDIKNRSNAKGKVKEESVLTHRRTE